MESVKGVKKILVTGSSGTIGTRLCETLMERGYEVQGVDWKHNKWADHVEKITVIGDLRDKASFENIDKDHDMIIHLAANARVYDLVIEPDLALDNYITIHNTLDFARKTGIKRFMFASSREVYGNNGKTTLKEDEANIIHCESPYSASKIGGESLTRAYGKCYGLDFIIFRFSNVYGMYDDSDRVVPLFIRQCKNGENLKVFGKEKMLDFTYIDDNIDGIIRCAENFDSIKNDTINIAYGEGAKILDVAEMIRARVNPDIDILIDNNRIGEVVRYTADISKMKRIGFDPKIGIVEGIDRSIDWYNKNLK